MPLRPNAPCFQPSIQAPNVHPVTVEAVSKTGNLKQGKSSGNRRKKKQKKYSQKDTDSGNATKGNEYSSLEHHDNEVTAADDDTPKSGPVAPKRSNRNRRKNKHKKNPKVGDEAKPSTGPDRHKNNVKKDSKNHDKDEVANPNMDNPQNFPALVSDRPTAWHSNIPVAAGEKDGPIISGGWATVAAAAANNPPATIEEQEHPILQNGNDGVRLTLLRAGGRSDNNDASKTTDPVTSLDSEKPSSQLDIIENNELAVEPGLENRKVEVYSDLKRQAPRLDMTKLRDRWWVLLRQQRALQQQKEAEEKEAEQTRILALQQMGINDASSKSDDDEEEEFVELSPLHFYNGQAEKKTANEEQAVVLEMDHLQKYLECPYPLHYAILNHDREALEGLLHLPPNKATSVQVNKDMKLGKNVEKWSPLQLAARLDKPDLLGLLLRSKKTQDDQSLRPTPLMIAAELGHEDCAQVFLSTASAAALFTAKDTNGNNVLHYCCGSTLQRGGSATLLQSLLEGVVHAGGTLPSKVLSCKNHLGQTPMHVACQRGKVELVEMFLSSLQNSSCFNVFLKVLSMKDKQEQTPLLAAIASGSTDLVMTLLMWRGNHHHHVGTKHRQKASAVSIQPIPASSDSKEKPDVCPLVWAIKAPETNSADMVRLLLEFHAPVFLSKAFTEEAGYDITHALHEAVLRSSSQRLVTANEETDTQDMLEIISALVEVGANPCEERELQRQQRSEQSKLWRESKQDAEPADSGEEAKKTTADPSSDNSASVLNRASGTNALTLAATMGHVPTMAALLDSLISYRRKLVVSRRRDPTLRKQPESFFRGLEKMEEDEMAAAVSDALVTSLYLGYGDNTSEQLIGNETSNGQPEKLSTGLQPSCRRATSDEYLSCSLVLFRRGARLGSTCLARLKCSLGTSILRRPDEVLSGNDGGSASARTASGFYGLSGLPACHCYNFRTGYRRENITLTEGGGGGRGHSLSMEDRSQLVCRLPWMKKTLRKCDEVHCDWMKETGNTSKTRLESFDEALQSDLVTLVTDHGAGRVIVHGSIVSQQSAKLAAAIRFARNSHGRSNHSSLNESVEKPLLEIDLSSAPTKLVILMLQHLYHGSITCGLNPSEALCREELLDLLLLSEEFLCPSLSQECEMRLLSENPYLCFCWSCNRAATVAATTNPFGVGEECIYSIDGPSKLITPEAVLDVVAVAQHIEETRMAIAEEETYVLDFAIRLISPPTNNKTRATSSEWTRLIPTKPVACLREVATSVLLYNFMEVLQSEAYASQLKDSLATNMGDDDHDSHRKQHENEAASLLLRMCLDELVSSDFKGAWDLPSLSMKRIFAASAKQQASQDVA